MSSDFYERYRDIAERFLVSAVVVDDQPYYGGAEPAVPLKQKPSRSARISHTENQPGHRNGQSLDAGAITESFSKIGLICGVVKPAYDGDVDVPAVKRADLVVIDWKLDDDGERALKLINSILDSDQGKDQRLRLIAVYTGESGIDGIGKQINKSLRIHGYCFEGVPKDSPVTLSRGHCHIEIYAKQGTPLNTELKERSVSEADLPGRLIDDFVRMTAGLMPSIALVALTAVRENPHRILDKFDGKLDAAFLTHRACLPIPDDSEQHMVAQIASELRAVMEEEVGRKWPARMEAIESWIKEFKGNKNFGFDVGNVSQKDVINLLKTGVDRAEIRIVSQSTSGTTSQESISNSKRERAHSWLTAGFMHPDDPSDLDLRLAWMTCFRAIDPPDKKLWLGTAVRRCGESGSEEFLLCMRPRCDSVRMTGRGSFLFLPLIEPKQDKFQLAVRSKSSDPPYRRVSVGINMSQWEMIKFAPDPTTEAVVARNENGSAVYVFTDVCGSRYEWIGELKSEVAHHVAQTLSSTLSRIALDRTEWLRRWGR